MYCRTTRAVSEIISVPLGRGCGRSPSVSCCSWHLRSSLTDPPDTAGADSTRFQRDTDVTHGFPVLCICLLCFLKTKPVLSAEWKLQIPADRRELEGRAGGQWRKGHPREAAASGWNLEMWSTQLVCPSLSCYVGTDWPGRGKEQVVFWSTLSTAALMGLMETWALLPVSLGFF